MQDTTNTPLEESRLTLIKALEFDIQSLKQERDKEVGSLTESLTRKNSILDVQRVKLNQYAFAVQESMVFLGKPLKKFEEWLASDTGDEISFEYAQSIPSKARESELIAGVSPKNTKPIASAGLDKKENPKAQMAVSEVNTIEYMRLSFLFLRNCQNCIKAIDNGTYTIPSPIRAEGEQAAVVSALEDYPIPVKSSMEPAIQLDYTIASPSKFTSGLAVIEGNEGDLSLEPLNDYTLPTKRYHCDLCRNALLLLDTCKDKLAASDVLVRNLSGRVDKEVKARKICQIGKDMIDSEIEEITAELFSRANQMVVDEAWKMDQLATTNRELRKQVRGLTNQVADKEFELAKAIKCLYELQTTQIDMPNPLLLPKLPNSLSQGSNENGNDNNNLKKREFVHSIVSGFDQFKSSISGDGFLFQEFQDFMRIIVLSSTQLSTQAYQSIHGSTFIKRSMIESIEPCLYYTYQPTNAFKPVGTGQTQFFKKKIIDLCIRGQVLITTLNNQNTTTPIAKSKCLMCTITRDCEYQVILGYDLKKPDVSTICRFCRDRVLAVQDFFSFITFLAVGKQGSTILSIFKKILWLKRRMAVAVIGNCSIFETELSAILGPDIRGEWEKHVELIY